jgi:serine/threonine protein kinase
MATVFDAMDVKVGRPVAVKVMLPELRNSGKTGERMRREGRIAAGVTHPHICNVTDVGTLADGSPYLVMDRLQGQTLAARIASQGPLAIAEITELVAQILSALSIVHDLGIVHRDLKPANVFLADVRGRSAIAKVLDFGSASLPRDDPHAVQSLGIPEVTLTTTGMVIGTPIYMAPEQAAGVVDLDRRVDIFAVGAILYEGLTGRRPFNARSYVALLHKIASGTPPSLRTFRRDVPDHIERCVECAMTRRREERYASALEFLEALGLAASRDERAPAAEVLENWDSPTADLPARGSGQR